VRFRAPGWDSVHDWQGTIAFDELPSVLNPEQGYIATANQAVTPPDYGHLLTTDWAYGYRSQRINDMIRSAPGKLSVADVNRMRFDNRNGMGAVARTGPGGRRRQGRRAAEGMGFPAGADSGPAAFYNATWRHLLARVFDELPPGPGPTGDDRWFEVVRRLLAEPASPWCDVRATTPWSGATTSCGRP